MARTITIETHGVDETAALAARLASVAMPGLVIALYGDLGAGKTQFVRAFSIALGVDPMVVNSPTFVLLQFYQGDPLLIAHMDAWRLNDLDEFLAVGGDEAVMCPDQVCLIEWADRIEDVLPADCLAIRIATTGEQSRRFELTAGAGRGERVLEALD